MRASPRWHCVYGSWAERKNDNTASGTRLSDSLNTHNSLFYKAVESCLLPKIIIIQHILYFPVSPWTTEVCSDNLQSHKQAHSCAIIWSRLTESQFTLAVTFHQGFPLTSHNAGSIKCEWHQQNHNKSADKHGCVTRVGLCRWLQVFVCMHAGMFARTSHFPIITAQLVCTLAHTRALPSAAAICTWKKESESWNRKRGERRRTARRSVCFLRCCCQNAIYLINWGRIGYFSLTQTVRQLPQLNEQTSLHFAGCMSPEDRFGMKPPTGPGDLHENNTCLRSLHHTVWLQRSLSHFVVWQAP